MGLYKTFTIMSGKAASNMRFDTILMLLEKPLYWHLDCSSMQRQNNVQFR